MNQKTSSDSLDFSQKPRFQINGWDIGKKTTRRKFSVNLDEEVGKVLDKKSQDSGLFMSRIINDSLRSHFGMSV